MEEGRAHDKKKKTLAVIESERNKINRKGKIMQYATPYKDLRAPAPPFTLQQDHDKWIDGWYKYVMCLSHLSAREDFMEFTLLRGRVKQIR